MDRLVMEAISAPHPARLASSSIVSEATIVESMSATRIFFRRRLDSCI